MKMKLSTLRPREKISKSKFHDSVAVKPPVVAITDVFCINFCHIVEDFFTASVH